MRSNGSIVRFAILGVYNVAISYLVFTLLYLQWGSSLHIQAIFWIATFVGLVNGFLTQRLFVWKSDNRIGPEFVRFLVANLSLSVLNAMTLQASLHFIGGNPLAHQAFLSLVFACISFLTSRNFIFSTSPKIKLSGRDQTISKRKQIDVFLQYYFPHVSGLTNMAVELAEAAAADGWDIHVHATGKETSNVERNSVNVHTYKRWFSLGRASFSPGLWFAIFTLRRRPLGIVHVHMPFPDSIVLSALLPKTTQIVVTYHCDSPVIGFGQSLIGGLLDWSQKNLLSKSSRVVFSSRDYGKSARPYRHLQRNQVDFIPVTCRDRSGGNPQFQKQDMRLIGFLGRPTHEKGIDVILDAMDFLPPDIGLLFAGPDRDLSEKPNYQVSKMRILEKEGRIFRTGFLEESKIPDFYASIDLLVFPSVNSFEAFGIVQVEAISAGVPVVSSDLPGVRTIPQLTGAGEVARIGDPRSLADKILLALKTEYDMAAAHSVLYSNYVYPAPHRRYLKLFEAVIGK